ncbi:DNA-binding response regulator [Kibdelosporangium aridum]|uniref:DNA-binding response regulator n=1 Tax=Kibdelosporangium aridum TaxID=2030 RepID=A0A428ZKB2_KIBAR|nr:response regulator transcription factor [Kibdelosporangium aridum]RSM88536.1 DNA-binding response regulator [Kibdelosporangium aridum]
MRVLVVEDDLRLAQLLDRGLAAEGFTVEVCHDGREGLWRATEYPYDVILLDLMLPGLNGYRVCAQLRQAGVWTPILMLTAKNGEHDEVEGLDTGADDYLTKPFSYLVLVARLRALIRRGLPERAAVLRNGDLELDPVDRTCRRGTSEITLTAKEYAVLEYLMRRTGQVVTKTEVIDHVWDTSQDPDPNLVEVYISALRRKIDTPFGRRTIVTVRGHGYQITAG